MATKHNIAEFSFAKDVVTNFPVIKEVFRELYNRLKPHEHFACAQHVLSSIEESEEMLTRQYAYYKSVYDKKGEE
jgi:hypothetical protein